MAFRVIVEAVRQRVGFKLGQFGNSYRTMYLAMTKAAAVFADVQYYAKRPGMVRIVIVSTYGERWLLTRVPRMEGVKPPTYLQFKRRRQVYWFEATPLPRASALSLAAAPAVSHAPRLCSR